MHYTRPTQVPLRVHCFCFCTAIWTVAATSQTRPTLQAVINGTEARWFRDARAQAPETLTRQTAGILKLFPISYQVNQRFLSATAFSRTACLNLFLIIADLEKRTINHTLNKVAKK